MERHILRDKSDRLFAECWELYNSSFPKDERRDLDYHTEAMQRDKFRCEAYTEGGKLIGILFWWELTNFRYIEHLATNPTERSKGYGLKIMSEFKSRDSKEVILEVEHPKSQINQRRIEFYKRLGYYLNEWEYSQPPYRPQGKAVSLLVMTSGGQITQSELNEIKKELFNVVHFRIFRIK